MKRIIYTFFMGMLCALNSIGQPFDVVLNSAQQGDVTVQARNSITLAAGYSYTPAGGTFLTQIVNPVVTGFTSYATAINPSGYSINTALAVGKTPGELNVSGMAGYTVPLDLPKGSAGLQPNLSLNYMSSFNDGLMGIGWNIGGLSSISRVNQNMYFENQSSTIKGDLTDKYAMDGKRLIVTSGTYGADGSVYGTELEEFSKVTAKSLSGTGQGPAWFEVRTKSGLICEYGKTSDSKVLLDGTCVLTWKINKISDRYGNCITFSYFESDDERPILQILYAGTTSTLAEINFRYKQRSDISTYVYGGKEFTRDLLLDNIEMKNNAQTYKKYVMEYMLDNYAQLQKTTEYSSQNQPLNPLVFTYTKQTDQVTYPVLYTNSVKERFFNGDFNGDGFMDFITVPSKTTYTTSDKWKLYKGSSTGQMIATSVEGFLNDQFDRFQIADMDGDGLDDLLRINKRNLAFYKSNITGFTVNPNICTIGTGDTNEYNIDCVDYNGDGILEIFRRVVSTEVNTNWWYEPIMTPYALYSHSGTLIKEGSCETGDTPDGKIIPTTGHNHILDFNGDGISDILLLYLDGYSIYTFNNDGSLDRIVAKYSTLFNNSNAIKFGDFNGDGTTDIISTNRPDYPDWSMLTLTKYGFKSHPIYGFSEFNLSGNINYHYHHDINGDGKMDIILCGKGKTTANSTNRINVAINKGNGYEYSLTEYTSPETFDLSLITVDNPIRFYFGDYNGDGRDDFFYSKAGSQKCFSFATGTPSNLLNNAIDGFGAKPKLLTSPCQMQQFIPVARGRNIHFAIFRRPCNWSNRLMRTMVPVVHLLRLIST